MLSQDFWLTLANKPSNLKDMGSARMYWYSQISTSISYSHKIPAYARFFAKGCCVVDCWLLWFHAPSSTSAGHMAGPREWSKRRSEMPSIRNVRRQTRSKQVRNWLSWWLPGVFRQARLAFLKSQCLQQSQHHLLVCGQHQPAIQPARRKQFENFGEGDAMRCLCSEEMWKLI